MNLCTNAYQAMREQPGILSISVVPVEISREDSKVISFDLPPGKFIRIEVSDTGQGISKEILDKIFDPYFSTKKKGEGTGLGLSMVHGIVKSYSGHITVYSEIGKGTTFNVYLPRLFIMDSIPEGKTSFVPLPRGTEKILVVDDQEEIAILIRHMLKSLDYEVCMFTSSKKALEAFRQSPYSYDLLITDMTMPSMTGVELAQRALAIRNDLSIILATGFSELITREKAQALGIAKYLMKPVTKKELALAVREVLDKVN
jgi:CheY-like chemotaxis protein